MTTAHRYRRIALPLLLSGVTATAAPQPAHVVQAVVDAMCDRSRDVWTEAETVDTATETPAHDTTYTQCDFAFVAQGRWYSLRYDHSLQVSRRWSWREEYRALTVFVLHADDADAQNGQRLLTQAIEDRGARGQATFGVTGTYGGIERIEHFYAPPTPALGDAPCIAEACKPVGAEHGAVWQQRYAEAISFAKARLQVGLTKAAMRRGTQ